MILRKVVVGNLQANCYIIADMRGGKGLIIDPGGDTSIILDFIEEDKLFEECCFYTRPISPALINLI